MRRLIAIAGVTLLGLAALIVEIAAKPGEPAGYRVNAIFDTAGNLIPGSDVEVAGVKVGTVRDIELTSRRKAAIEIEIKQPGIAPFKTDASCSVGVNSLIGEMFVQCKPGSSGAPELTAQKGQRLPTVSVEHTTTPVPVDYVLDQFRGTATQRLRIILMEFGIGLAGRGQDLNAILRRSNPALLQTNRVLKILSRQNRQLRDLTAASDQIFVSLAAERKRVADSIVQINKTAQASAARREEIAQSIERLPALLRELKPTMRQIGALSEESTPLLADFRQAAPDLNRFLIDLGPLAEEGTPALKTLGHLADEATPVLKKADPLFKKADALTVAAEVGSNDLSKLLSDLRDTGGIERLMDLIFYVSGASSPFDRLGHYVISRLIVNICEEYATAGRGLPTCSAQIKETPAAKDKSKQAAGSSGRAVGSAGQRQVLDYLLGK